MTRIRPVSKAKVSPRAFCHTPSSRLMCRPPPRPGRAHEVQAVDLAVLAALAVADVAHGEAAAFPHQVIVVLRADLAVFEAPGRAYPGTGCPFRRGCTRCGRCSCWWRCPPAAGCHRLLPGGDIVTEVLVSHHIPTRWPGRRSGHSRRCRRRRSAPAPAAASAESKAAALHGTLSPAAHSNRSRR